MNTPAPAFREVQRFREWWLWALLLISTVPVIAAMSHSLYQQFVLGEPPGTNPVSDVELIVVSALVIGLCLGVLWLFVALKLIVEVRPEALYLRFRPFVRKQIPYDEITRCEARTYSPIKEYGGWGIRWGLGKGGAAYNVSGNEGVQLELENGKRLLLGSQRAGELAAAIRARLPAPAIVSR